MPVVRVCRAVRAESSCSQGDSPLSLSLCLFLSISVSLSFSLYLSLFFSVSLLLCLCSQMRMFSLYSGRRDTHSGGCWVLMESEKGTAPNG